MSAVDEVVASLSAQDLESRLEERDGATVFVIDDGEISIEITDEVGSKLRAAAAYKRLAVTALARAETLLAEGRRLQGAT